MRAQRRTGSGKGVAFLARWPADKAMQHARDRIRELTDRRRTLLQVKVIVWDVNRFLRGWAGCFRRELGCALRQDQELHDDAAGGICRHGNGSGPVGRSGRMPSNARAIEGSAGREVAGAAGLLGREQLPVNQWARCSLRVDAATPGLSGKPAGRQRPSISECHQDSGASPIADQRGDPVHVGITDRDGGARGCHHTSVELTTPAEREDGIFLLNRRLRHGPVLR
ncbi:MAG: RNA-directed polymerase [Mycobacterium sp.]|nr:RNA-directed polymerase [Mycobacterium sp.]